MSENEAREAVGVATVATEHGAKYAAQLAKHFGHRVPVESDAETGRGVIRFPGGDCHLAADRGALTLRVASPSAEKTAELQDVVARHLVRFAFREELDIAWQAA